MILVYCIVGDLNTLLTFQLVRLERKPYVETSLVNSIGVLNADSLAFPYGLETTLLSSKIVNDSHALVKIA